MILLDATAVRAFWNGHAALTRLVDNSTDGATPVLVPAACLQEAETHLPGSGPTILAQPCIQVLPLGQVSAVAAGVLAHEHPELTTGQAHALQCVLPDLSHPAGHVILSTEPDAYPHGVPAFSIDHPGLLGP
ncbi:hypothetical protein [Streptacidiphilus sp. EB129]|uniref:hypothetical protein n=1 Tax=Streptacidiphilus sp. EB129 TaxID=3156262 RepID=UPI0035141463